MNKKLILALIGFFVNVSIFAEYLGEQPSIDFTLSPEIFLGNEQKSSNSGIKSHSGYGATGNLLLNLKFTNKIYEYDSTIEKYNVFGFYLKNSYSAHSIKNGQTFDTKIGGGIHGALPIIPIGMEVGLLYTPVFSNLILEDFVGYMGDKITVGIRTSVCFTDDTPVLMEFLLGWNLRFDIRNKTYKRMLEQMLEEKEVQDQKDWKINHSFQKEQKVGDIDFFRQMLKGSNLNFDESIYDIPLIVTGYTSKDNSEILLAILLSSHNLSEVKIDSLKEETMLKTLKISTEEEKQEALNEIILEYNIQNEIKKRTIENELLKKAKQAKLFNAAVSSRNINIIADYIKDNYDQEYFDYSAYNEIAKLLDKNPDVELKNLPAISNPYGLDRNCIYLANDIYLYQWTGNGTFLAKDFYNDLIYIRTVYDLTGIEQYTDNVFLRYAGTFEYNSISAGIQVVPQFDLIFNIKGIPHGK